MESLVYLNVREVAELAREAKVISYDEWSSLMESQVLEDRLEDYIITQRECGPCETITAHMVLEQEPNYVTDCLLCGSRNVM